jgi:carboxymethylenebutenolidase
MRNVLLIVLFASAAFAQQPMEHEHPMPAATTTATTSAAPASQAQDWAKQHVDKSPRHHEWVSIKTAAGRTISAFVVYPERPTKAPAIVVIHEIFGMSDWVQMVSDEFAEAGYIAIAPDLLSGQKLTDPTAIGKAIRDLPPDQITSDLTATADYVSKLPASTGRVAVAGFCWGGGQAFRFATNWQNLAAAYVFYGPGPDKTEDVARIKAPVYGFYAGNDARIGATVPKTQELMQAASKTYEVETYAGAGHGFMRAGEAPDASPENRKARDDSWARLKKLLGKL